MPEEPAEKQNRQPGRPQDGIQQQEFKYVERLRSTLISHYAYAEELVKINEVGRLKERLGDTLYNTVAALGSTRHAARGVALTLLSFKTVRPDQDIRYHKAEQPGGFSARTLDASATVPFLRERGLEYNVETHWLSQTLSFAGPYTREQALKTVPKEAGPLLIEVLNSVEELGVPDLAGDCAVLLLAKLIQRRNQGTVQLTIPKNLTISQIAGLLETHFAAGYTTNAPRLPQVAIYSMYQCLTASMPRYKDMHLEKLLRMKAADRKAGTVGDIVVSRNGNPVEAVEIKFDVPIRLDHVAEAVEKIKTASVERYLILSTDGVDPDEYAKINEYTHSFRQINGCEIIVNGVLDTIKYYLRLLSATVEFIVSYTKLLNEDEDLKYEHRKAWNDCCAKLG